ncbi:HK97 gp10 family phage protein [uncultured Ruminococcus sp.]|uniref:HK97 gp10 family phage protein n=1 Tax=uncultured Ruminococcus sp. TaxID=165186 RepID=UPI0025D1897A|nr:HK97 gp10 family phage protein [uncultured Ruminococcus sp.]
MSYQNLKADLTGLVAELNKYSDEVMADIDREADKIANNAKKRLKETSPYREHKEGDSSKHYRDSWKKKKNKHKTRFGLSEGIQVLSASKPHLTHLLENGHRVVLPQGREFKKDDAKHFVGAKKHIQPVQEEVNDSFLAAVDEVLRRHGK